VLKAVDLLEEGGVDKLRERCLKGPSVLHRPLGMLQAWSSLTLPFLWRCFAVEIPTAPGFKPFRTCTESTSQPLVPHFFASILLTYPLPSTTRARYAEDLCRSAPEQGQSLQPAAEAPSADQLALSRRSKTMNLIINLDKDDTLILPQGTGATLASFGIGESKLFGPRAADSIVLSLFLDDAWYSTDSQRARA
jgi:hypothetical protein